MKKILLAVSVLIVIALGIGLIYINQQSALAKYDNKEWGVSFDYIKDRYEMVTNSKDCGGSPVAICFWRNDNHLEWGSPYVDVSIKSNPKSLSALEYDKSIWGEYSTPVEKGYTNVEIAGLKGIQYEWGFDSSKASTSTCDLNGDRCVKAKEGKIKTIILADSGMVIYITRGDDPYFQPLFDTIVKSLKIYEPEQID